MTFIVGQRWISHSEPELGLGVIVEKSGRRVTISFPAVAEERIYALDNAPLSRIIYQTGDHITTQDERQLTVESVAESQGICFYTGLDNSGQQQRISELELNCQVILTTPRQRLLSGQLDKETAYQLRIDTLFQLDRWQRSPVRGLLGARTSLLPHQVYIAAEVAQRQAPRVLLADEVGLGKTIEAGMILHQQLLTGRAGRVLIVVPPTLVHQWLVEMLRRFNLRFAIFDSERLQALLAEGPANPFDSEQLVICSQDFLCGDTAALELATTADWDLLVVDEAHHLHWSEREVGPEYLCIERLARAIPGLLLLTATPEQAGVSSHFARLRLLDPSRFHDLAAFRAEEAGYQPLNLLVQRLADAPEPLDPSLLQQLEPYLGAQLPPPGDDQREAIIARLLDRHGTGRVMFRNTRAAIPHFPARELHTYPLPCPSLYTVDGTALGLPGLQPEAAHPEESWLAEDPRVTWLHQLLRELKGEKVLVICARADTATALEVHLHLRLGIRTTAFHEGLSIVERDRAAAWFADTESGAQALVCSEIGSEGRNFQFAHHLVLFDLPLNPDLLEQRIGRLDRIGQTRDIALHVPYLQASATEVLLRWFDDGLDLFRHSFSAGYAIYEQFQERLHQQLADPDAGQALSRLIEDTRAATDATRQALQEGRDPLLELNSCHTPRAEALIQAIEEAERADELQRYMELSCEVFGVDHDELEGDTWVLRPTEHMLTDHFPGLRDQGTPVTFSRARALVREDIGFLSWEHPIVAELMDDVVRGDLGSATVASISVRGLPPGTLLLEACFTVSCMAPARLQLERYLSLSPLRLLVDSQGRDLSAVISHPQLNQLCAGLKRATAQAIITQARPQVETMLERTQTMADRELPRIVADARAALERALKGEIERLVALQRVNPAVRDEEIERCRNQLAQSEAAIQQATVAAQGLRVVVST